jgi:hypothetical protein
MRKLVLNDDRMARLVRRFELAKPFVVDQNGCWIWQKGKSNTGYGLISIYDKNMISFTAKAHRASYMINVGPIPEGLSILHRCDNPPCCNPEHLTLGTHRQNMFDRKMKGRHANGNGRVIDRERVRQLFKDGKTIIQVANELGAHFDTIKKIKRRLKASENQNAEGGE